MTNTSTQPVITFDHATFARGERVLWRDLSFAVNPGELVVILGSNGTGKTTLLRAVLGLLALSKGSVRVHGVRPATQRHSIGYIPQQKAFDPDIAIRGRDIVEFGLVGDRYGISTLSHEESARVQRLLHTVGAARYADAPVGLLSGGEQQRLRIAQALVRNPSILLADEPFLSLDAAAQRRVVELLAEEKAAGTAILVVTHDVSATLLPHVDTVLYLASGSYLLGTPREVLTSAALSKLHDSPVQVLNAGGRVLVVPEEARHE